MEKTGNGKAEVLGRIHSVETFGAVDGPGIRYVLFLQGCPLKCLYCHNPDSWDTEGGKLMTPEQVISDIRTYKNFIRSGGVTISGGEPLYQPDFVTEVLKRCHALGIHTAVDTSGSVALAISKPVIDHADMLLLDIKALDEALSIQLTGKSNVNTLEILNYCQSIQKRIWIRHVLVPGYTLDLKRLEELADFLKPYTCVEKIEFLPFHKMGEFKWEELGKEYQLYDTPAPTKQEVDQVIELFRSKGLPI